MSYDDAVDAYHKFVTSRTHWIYSQPSGCLSTFRRGVWYLHNMHGLLAQVGCRSGRVFWPRPD